ncbi:MAG TPA: RidA family protein [Gemmatimonadaceae bacterium]|jgi:enamine deaminase RidA (YjgF/YER057c/UK114 family)
MHSRRPRAAGALALLALCLLAARARAQSIERHAATPPGLILQAVTVPAGATTLYLSGQVAAPLDPALRTPAAERTPADFGDTRTQTVSVLRKIQGILEARGYTMRDVVKLTVFLVGDPTLGGQMDFAGMNEGFRQFFGSAENPNTVARSTIQVAALAAPGYLVEIEATAARVP